MLTLINLRWKTVLVFENFIIFNFSIKTFFYLSTYDVASLSKNQSSKNQYSFNNKAMMKSYSKNQLKKCAKVSCFLESSVKCDGCDCGDDENGCCCLNKEKFFEHNRHLKKFNY